MVRKDRPETPEGVISLDRARAERLVDEVKTLADQLAASVGETVAAVLKGYRAWERANPEAAVRSVERLEMIRLGFVGPGGFDRCHREERVPRSAYPWDDPIHDDDRRAAQVLMCPLMEARRCESVWSAFNTPPCYLLLLEAHDALGRGADDWKVGEVLGDFGKLPPDQYRKTFARADRLIREAQKARAAREAEDEGA